MINIELNSKNIMKLWQNPQINDVNVNIYEIVNRYLLNGGITASKEVLNKFNMNEKQFKRFLDEYIDKLKLLLYKTPQKAAVLYRGEHRPEFNYKIGDVITFKNFHSTTDKIAIAYSFSQNFLSKNKRILFIMDVPKGCFYKKLNLKMEFKMKNGVTQVANEFEYLIPPNSYYVITGIESLGNVGVIKMKMIKQDKNIPDLDITLKRHIDFWDKTYEDFKKMHKYYNNQMAKLKAFNIKYKIDSHTFYKLIVLDNIFNLDWNKLEKIINILNTSNYKAVANKLKSFGIPYENYELLDVENYIKYIKSLTKLFSYKIHKVDKLKLYNGYFNFNNDMTEPEFISILKSTQNGVYDKCLYGTLFKECFLYDCFAKNFETDSILIKNGIKVKQYYKYLLEFNLENVGIIISKKIEFDYETRVIIVPTMNYSVKSISKIKNKYGGVVYYYKILLTTL